MEWNPYQRCHDFSMTTDNTIIDKIININGVLSWFFIMIAKNFKFQHNANRYYFYYELIQILFIKYHYVGGKIIADIILEKKIYCIEKFRKFIFYLK